MTDPTSSKWATDCLLKTLNPPQWIRFKAFHSDPEDAELVLVVKEALAHLDHALLDAGTWRAMAKFWGIFVVNHSENDY